MAASSASLLARRLLLSRRFLSSPLRPVSTTTTPSSSSSSSTLNGSDAESDPELEHDQAPGDQDRQQAPNRPRPPNTTRPLENGLDPGIYKV
jgi:single-strand DNA-binding protein